jgi:hypothetical protein
MVCLGLGVGIRVLDRAGKADAGRIVTGIYIPDTSVVVREDHPAVRLVNVLNPYAQRHEGFLGFVDLRPVRSLRRPHPVPPPIVSDDAEAGEPEDMTVYSFSPTAGIDTGIYVAPGDDIIFGASGSEPRREVVNRQIEVVVRVDPEYPLVARNAGKEGEIIALVYIDTTGELGLFPDWITGEEIRTLEFAVNGRRKSANYALYEDPTGWFFADNFLKVLPGWRFVPRIEDSRPVASLLRIRYHFCLGVNCLRYELIPVEGNVN